MTTLSVMTTTTMKRTVAAGALILALVVGCGTAKARAQESSGATKGTEQERSKPAEAYRLDFSINELEDGKKINTRQYSLNLNANDDNEIRIAMHIPVEVKEGEIQNLDVSTSIWSRLRKYNDQLELSVRSTITNFATPDQAHDSRPVLRELKINASTLVLLGKPMMLGSVDDPNSKRQFQLEVTVTKLR